MPISERQPRFGLGQVYLDANAEAKRMGDRRVSTEHLLLAVLAGSRSSTAAGAALGVDLDTARDAVAGLDRKALTSLGLDTVFAGPVFPGRQRDRLRLTPAARATFTGLRKTANGERISVKHVLLSLLNQQRPDPAAALIDALGVDRAAARGRLSNWPQEA